MNKRIEELEIALIALKTEFESFKAYHDKIVEHLNQAGESKEAEITRLKNLCVGFSWAKWVATDYSGDIWAYAEEPIKFINWWRTLDANCEKITPEQAIFLCGRLPEWSEDEPIPVKQ